MSSGAEPTEITDILSTASAHEEGQDEQTKTRREICNACRRPAKVCLCDVLPRPKLSCKADVIVFQNPEEAKSAKGTIPLLELCLKDFKVVCGRKFNHHDFPERILQASNLFDDMQKGIAVPTQSVWHRTLLLWPTQDSEDLEEVVQKFEQETRNQDDAEKLGTPERILLVLLDGTWPACGQMLRKSKVLRQLRHVKFNPPDESIYSIRIEPHEECRSSLEAAAEALRILEGGDRGLALKDSLLLPLRRMVELQCSFISNPKHKPGTKNYRPNRYPPHLCTEQFVMAKSEAARDKEWGQRPLVDHQQSRSTKTIQDDVSEVLQSFQNVRKNKVALIQHLVQQAHTIEKNWENYEMRISLLEAFRECLLDIQTEEDKDLMQIARLGPKMKTFEFPLSHFLAISLPIERKFSRGLRDHEFLITTDDTQLDASMERKDVFPLVVILDNLRSAFNVGSIFRTSECLGIESIILCGYTSTPEDSQTSKSAMGMDKIVPWKWFKTVEEAISEMKKRNYTVVALETVVGCPDVFNYSFPRTGCALVLGNERYGIDTSHVSLCDSVVKIPCRGIKNSLNVASAYGICAYEITRQWSCV